MRVLDLTPTPLFPHTDHGRLEQLAHLRLSAETAGHLTAHASTEDGRSASTALTVRAGEHTYDLRIPEIRPPARLEVRLLAADGQAIAAETIPCRPARRWTVYVMPTSHIDLYSTGLAQETPEEHARILDAALALAEGHPHYRFQIENMLPIFEFRELRPAQLMTRLVETIRAGQIAFGAQYTGVHQEEASAEELVQGQFLKMRQIEADYGIRPNCGYTVDVPAATIQYAQLLARCGIPYWIFSPNRFPPPDGWYGLGQSIRRLPRLLRALASDDSSVLAWLPHEHYGQDRKLFGLDGDDIDAAAALIANRLLGLEQQDYPWDAYLLEYSYGDNLPPTPSLPLLVSAWQRIFTFPRLVLATADQFFRHIEKASPDPPELRLEILDAWAWIVGAQGVLNQLARRAANDLLCAQALWSLRSNGDCPEGRFREAFSKLAKFAAHDWWYGGGQMAGVPDLAKAAWAYEARGIATAVLEEAIASAAPTGSSKAVIVNPCAFPHRAVVVAPSDAWTPGEGASPCQAVDVATLVTHFRPQPYTAAHPPAGDDQEDAVIFPADLSPLGGQAAHAGPVQPSRRHEELLLENKYFRVEFDPSLGTIASVLDKENGRDLASTDADGFAQLLLGGPQLEGFGIGFAGSYEQGIERMRRSLKSWQPCRLEFDHGLSGPVFSSLLLRGRVHTSPLTQAVILYEDLKRVDVTISIDWDNEPRASRLVVAFPFAFGSFSCRYEIPFTVLEVGRDETPTSPRHLRQLQTWLQFSDGEHSIILASPDVGVFSLGRCDLNPIDDGEYTVPDRPAAYFTLTDNGAPSPLVQPGRLAARFSLTSGRGLRPSDCTRFGWGFAREPLLASRPAADPLGPIEVRPDSLLISTVKRAWDGHGLIVRVIDYDGVATDAVLRLPFQPREAWLTDPVERPISPAVMDGHLIRFRNSPHEVSTWLIKP